MTLNSSNSTNSVTTHTGTPHDPLSSIRVAMAANPAQHSVYMTITPMMAKELLANHNARNRAISRKHVVQHSKRLREGLYRPDHPEGITLTVDLAVGDGQHRLSACAETGIPLTDQFTTLNAAADILNIMGSGRGRSVADRYNIVHGTKFGAKLKRFYQLCASWQHMLATGTSHMTRVKLGLDEEIQEAMAALEADYLNARDKVRNVPKNSRISDPLCYFLFHLLSSVDDGAEKDAITFMNTLSESSTSRQPSQVADFLKHFDTYIPDSNTRQDARDPMIIANLIISWNAYRANRTGTRLPKWRNYVKDYRGTEALITLPR